jgi:hypothetical protein
MKSYPSIPSVPIEGSSIWAFDKIDGSQIRAEWSKKRGFYKFGSRRQLIGSNNLLGEAEGLIRAQADQLAEVFKAQRWDRVVAFFEFAGPNSFAGQHEREDHQVTLFDVNPYKKGILGPKEFVKVFEGVEGVEGVVTSALLYRGLVTEDFLADVRGQRLEGMTFEGVVCKGGSGHKLFMFKVKNRAWVEKVKAMYADAPEKLKELL